MEQDAKRDKERARELLAKTVEIWERLEMPNQPERARALDETTQGR